MLYAIYAGVLFILTIYSYSQIDLNLTLSSNKIYQFIQQQLIFLGYYNRLISTIILSIILVFLFLMYLRILFLIKEKKLSVQNIKWLVIITAAILFFSYSAFSHDLFNYMFDARIITRYGQNPYLHSALDFPDDLWTRFMHWTHRTYPYGPVWLVITLIPSIFGFGKFVLTLFNFKLLFLLFHIGNVYLIYKILEKTNPKLSLLGTAVYAFNPVVLIESLISPHNEVQLLFFLLLAIYFIFIENNRLMAILNLLFSVGVKFTTLVLLPLFFFVRPGKNLGKNTRILLLFLVLLLVTLVAEILYREPYSWYFIPIVGLGALLVEYTNINIFIGGATLASFLRYLPFIYTGGYEKSTRNTQDLLFTVTVGLTALIIIFNYFRQKVRHKIS